MSTRTTAIGRVCSPREPRQANARLAAAQPARSPGGPAGGAVTPAAHQHDPGPGRESSCLSALATGPSTPKNAQIVAIVLTNTTTLNWNANTEANLAGYEVVWRETTSPAWDHVIPAGNVTTVTVDIAKDNVQFGVRAVDKAGNRSPVAFPEAVTS